MRPNWPHATTQGNSSRSGAFNVGALNLGATTGLRTVPVSPPNRFPSKSGSRVQDMLLGAEGETANPFLLEAMRAYNARRMFASNLGSGVHDDCLLEG